MGGHARSEQLDPPLRLSTTHKQSHLQFVFSLSLPPRAWTVEMKLVEGVALHVFSLVEAGSVHPELKCSVATFPSL